MARVTLTMGDLKAWAEANEVSDDHVLLLEQASGDTSRCVDLSVTETESGRPAVKLQRRWG